jgi:hypothetical protein
VSLECMFPTRKNEECTLGVWEDFLALAQYYGMPYCARYFGLVRFVSCYLYWLLSLLHSCMMNSPVLYVHICRGPYMASCGIVTRGAGFCAWRGYSISCEADNRYYHHPNCIYDFGLFSQTPNAIYGTPNRNMILENISTLRTRPSTSLSRMG